MPSKHYLKTAQKTHRYFLEMWGLKEGAELLIKEKKEGKPVPEVIERLQFGSRAEMRAYVDPWQPAD